MQYKFYVDGQSCHDEHQPHVSAGENGMINTVFLPTDPNYMPSPEMASGSNMDVDNEAFRRMVRISYHYDYVHQDHSAFIMLPF